MAPDYDIHLDDKFGALRLIDVAAEAAAHEPWFNQTLTQVNDAVVRLGILQGEYHWHKHDEDDEFFRQFRRQPSNAPGMWSREEIVARYCERMGFSVSPDQWRFYEVFGLFRLAVIAQQIWYRYYHRQTTNEAYAIFGPAVGYLEQRCRRLLGL